MQLNLNMLSDNSNVNIKGYLTTEKINTVKLIKLYLFMPEIYTSQSLWQKKFNFT